MKKTDFTADVNTWLEFAAYDLKSALWQLKGEIYTSACFAAQQAAEKSLKALILSHGKVAPKVHSLDHLLSILRRLKVVVAPIETEALELDKYYITTRYPGQYGGPEELYTENDARTAVENAQAIFDFVNKLTPYTTKKKPRTLGKFKGQITVSDDFDDEDEEINKLFYG